MPFALQRFGQPGQASGHVQGHLGLAFAWVQAQGVEPDVAQELPDGFLAQAVELDAVVFGVREGSVGRAGAAEFGVEFEAVAHVGHYEERRAAFPGGKRPGVGFGLVFGPEHGCFPGPGAAPEPSLGAYARQHGAFHLLFLGLLGLQDKGPLPVQVDAAPALGAVAVLEDHIPFEAVGAGFPGFDRSRLFKAEQTAEVYKKMLGVGPLGTARGFPFGDEFVDVARHVGGYAVLDAPGQSRDSAAFPILPEICFLLSGDSKRL